MKNEPLWKRDPDPTLAENDSSVCLVCESQHLRAQLRFDGCVNLWDDEDGDGIHLCKCPQLLEELMEIGKDKFDEWD